MDVPISLGVLLATGMSLYQTTRGSEQVYFDAAVTLLFFLLIGRNLDQSVRRRAAGAAANLLGLRASTATVLQPDGTTLRVGARALKPGMRILTVAGERFAVDGQGCKRARGRLMPAWSPARACRVAVRPGDLLYAGTLNLSGTLEMQATATDENTLLAEIGRLMTSAEQARGRYVRLADRAARFYAPAVHILGLATLLGWLAMGHGWQMALTAAIAVLIITCPCALALAVPVVQVAATSRLFAQGVLVKAPDALERLAEVDTVVFDKTGTLTRGEPCLIPDPRPKPSDPAGGRVARGREPASVCPSHRAGGRSCGLGYPAGGRRARNCRFRPRGEQRARGPARLGSATWCGVDTLGSDLATVWYRRGDAPAVPLTFEDRLRSDAKRRGGVLARRGLSGRVALRR